MSAIGDFYHSIFLLTMMPAAIIFLLDTSSRHLLRLDSKSGNSHSPTPKPAFIRKSSGRLPDSSASRNSGFISAPGLLHSSSATLGARHRRVLLQPSMLAGLHAGRLSRWPGWRY